MGRELGHPQVAVQMPAARLGCKRKYLGWNRVGQFLIVLTALTGLENAILTL